MSRDKAVSVRELVAMIDRKNPVLPISRQAELLGIARSSIYFEPIGLTVADEVFMRAIDELYTAHPFYGSRKITKQLSRDRNEAVNRKRVQRLMRLMGIEAIYPKPNLSQNTATHPVYPYLLKGLPIVRPNQVWGTDITYIRMKHGFVYLVAFIDWFSRLVLSWKLSTTMEASFCIDAAHEAIKTYGPPEIANSDQGVQFTSYDYLDLWKKNQVNISMDGRGRAMDNIFTERLWRSVKYEEVYLKDYETVSDVNDGLANYFPFYNTKRLHQSLNYQTPNEIYFREKK